MIRPGRLLSMAIGELGASAVFLLVYLSWDGGSATLIALLFLLFLLIQGSLYWFLRYAALAGKVRIGGKTVRTLRVLKNVDFVLCLIVPVLVVATAERRGDLWLALSIHVFAVLEYINYYWYRLSYGKSGFNVGLLRERAFEPSSMARLMKRKGSHPADRGEHERGGDEGAH